MPWGMKRQLFYALVVLGVVAVLVVVLGFVFFYKAPTCIDGKMNQNEEGVDCGGVCVKVCEAPAISAVWARSVKVADGVYQARRLNVSENFFKLVKAGFASRRKLLIKNLGPLFKQAGDKDLKMLFGELGLSLTVRAQEVSIPVWKSLVAAYRG
jgi:hypothetical protein